MKKLRYLSLLLCLILAVQTLALPVSADETTGETEPGEGTEQVVPASEAVFGTVSIQNGCRTINGMVPLAGTERKLETSQGVFLYEMATNTVVYSYNPDNKLAPGNLAKMVTGLLALEMCGLKDIVTVNSVNISKLPAGSLNQNLKHDEQLTVESLIYCMFLQNANDAAIALAEHVAGTQQAFVSLMNARVKQMGCTSTEFGNVHGLDTARSYTTARDIAKIVVEAIKNEEFKKIFGAISYEVPATERSEKRDLKTLNYMMDQSIVMDFYTDRVNGGIQSYAPSYGANLVCTASIHSDADPSRNLDYVAVVLGAARTNVPNSWRIQSYGNFNEMTELLNLGFDKYKANRILYEGMSLSQFPVAGGESNAVGQAIVDYDSVVPISATMDNLTVNYSIKDALTAPVAKGQMIGTMEIWYRNSCMAEAEIYAMGDVRSAKNTGVTIRSTAARRDTDDSGIMSVIGTICMIVLGLAVAYLAFNAYMRSRIRAQRRRRREARRRNY